jgi:hypothetical protein
MEEELHQYDMLNSYSPEGKNMRRREQQYPVHDEDDDKIWDMMKRAKTLSKAMRNTHLHYIRCENRTVTLKTCRVRNGTE